MPLGFLRESRKHKPLAAPTAREASKAGRLNILDQIEAIGVGCFWATDKEGRLIYLSPMGLEMLGKAHADPIGKPFTEVFKEASLDDGEAAQRTLAFQLRAHSKIENQVVEVEQKDGESRKATRWWRLSGKPLIDENGDFWGYRGSSIDISAEFERQRDAQQQSLYDALTGLSNRRRMTVRLKSTLDAYRAAKRSCAMMMLDLDRFKQVNDTLGHPAGDELLRQVAERLKAVIKNRGEIGRLGGDEFQVILPDIDDRGELADLAARIIQMVSQPYSINGKRAIIGTSVGVAIAPYDGLDSEELNIAADMALYAAKGGGAASTASIRPT